MRRFPWLLWALFAIFFFHSAAPVFAADAEHAAPGGPLEIRYDTAFWAVLIFLGMLVILRRKAWAPILEGLKKREETIRSSLQEAKNTRDEMEKMRADFQKELTEAHQQIPKLMDDARKKAEEMSNEMRAKAAADVQAERQRLRQEVAMAKDQAIKEIWEQAANLATMISAKAIGRSLTDDDHRRLLDEAMGEMRQSVRN
jgi:F-type H+-transporting ATPase subunit b